MQKNTTYCIAMKNKNKKTCKNHKKVLTLQRKHEY